MSKYIFNKGQTVFFLYDPEFYDEDLEGEIAKGVITELWTANGEICYGITTPDGIYDRLESDLYVTFYEAKRVVDAYFADYHEHSMARVNECKEELHDAMLDLRKINKRIKRWESKSKQLQEELEKS